MNIKLPGVLYFLSVLYINQSIAAGVNDTRPAELKYHDKRLNEAYQAILSRIRESDRVKLRAAQRAWLKMRDLDCKWAASAEPMDCLIDRTANRVNELRESYFWTEEGNYTKLAP